MNIELIGFIAGIITTSAQIPQIIKSLKTKSTYDVSLLLYVILFTAISLWVLYGYLVDNQTVFIMNLLLLSSVSVMILLKLKYGMKNESKRSQVK